MQRYRFWGNIKGRLYFFKSEVCMWFKVLTVLRRRSKFGLRVTKFSIPSASPTRSMWTVKSLPSPTDYPKYRFIVYFNDQIFASNFNGQNIYITVNNLQNNSKVFSMCDFLWVYYCSINIFLTEMARYYFQYFKWATQIFELSVEKEWDLKVNSDFIGEADKNSNCFPAWALF